MPQGGGSTPRLSDITDRMAAFGRLFGEDVGIAEPTWIPSADDLVELVESRMPRGAAREGPVLEAAAFMGEWLRARTDASWVAEGPHEPHLQIVDETGSIVYLVPIVSILRLASTAGYDGLPHLLEGILGDANDPPPVQPLDEMRVRPARERSRIVAWVRANRHTGGASRAALWRRCQSCSRSREESAEMQEPGPDWDEDAAELAAALARRPFECPCGGLPGEMSRFLMVRAADGETRVADILIAGTFTRVGCWTLDGDRVVPYDAAAVY